MIIRGCWAKWASAHTIVSGTESSRGARSRGIRSGGERLGARWHLRRVAHGALRRGKAATVRQQRLVEHTVPGELVASRGVPVDPVVERLRDVVGAAHRRRLRRRDEAGRRVVARGSSRARRCRRRRAVAARHLVGGCHVGDLRGERGLLRVGRGRSVVVHRGTGARADERRGLAVGGADDEAGRRELARADDLVVCLPDPESGRRVRGDLLIRDRNHAREGRRREQRHQGEHRQEDGATTETVKRSQGEPPSENPGCLETKSDQPRGQPNIQMILSRD